MTHSHANTPESLRLEDLGSLAAWVTWAHSTQHPAPSTSALRRPASLPGGERAARAQPFRQVTAVTLGNVDVLPGWLHLRPPGVSVVEISQPATGTDVATALAAGVRAADAAIDSGADLVVPVIGPMGPATHSAAAIAVATLVPAEPVWVLGFERRAAPAAAGYADTVYCDDASWMRRCCAVRDAVWQARSSDAEALLEQLAEPNFCTLVGALLQLADRSTAVLLDGPLAAAAALVASRINLFAADSYYAPQRHGDAAERYALDSMGLEPVANLGLRCGHGIGALLLLPVLQATLAAHHIAAEH